MKTMRVSLFMLGVLLLGSPSIMAQSKRFSSEADSIKCTHNLSFYRDYVRSGDFASAVGPWRIVMEVCPRGISQWPLADGENIVKRHLMVQPGMTHVRQAGLVDTLLLIYDIRLTHYPQNTNTVLLKRIFDVRQYRPEKEEFILSDIEQYLNLIGSDADMEVAMIYMDIMSKLYEKEVRTAEDMMNAYTWIIDLIEKQEAKSGGSEQTANAKAFTENVLITSGVASCENLVTLFTPRFQADPGNLDLVKKIVSLLTTSECDNSELFVRSVTALNKLDPSYKTAYYLYRLHASKGEYDLAIKYLQENIDSPDISSTEKGANMIDLGGLYLRTNNSSRALSLAENGMRLNPAVKGRAYLLMANVWAAQKCGGSDIEVRAPFWVASDYAAKAKAADPACAKEADRLIAHYRQYFPLTEEAFMHDIMDGSTYTVVCGNMRETTTVRTRK